MNQTITIYLQAFYGNRTITTINANNLDRIILGYIDNTIEIASWEKIDRTIVKIPGTDNLVLVYNRFKEENKLENAKNRKSALRETARVPELNLVLYSRCAACRMNDKGELTSIQPEDLAIVNKYFAE